MKAVGYISSDKTHEIEIEIDLRIQKERIEDFCRKNGYKLSYVFEEPSSSTEDNKPELFRMLNKAANKEFDMTIVLKLDCFGKDKVAKIWVMDELKKHKVALYSLTEDILPSSLMSDKESKKKAESIKNRVQDIPSLPEVVTKVMELVQNPKSSAAQLGKVIAHDAGLTSRVLKLVNSAYYGFPKQISSIQHAIMIVGFTTIRGLVLSSSIFKIFAPKDNVKMLDYKKLWKHALLSAVASKNINKYLSLNFDEHVFSASILHDIGKIILDQFDHANYIQALADAPDPFDYSAVIHAEQAYCGVNHCDIGFMVAEKWNLPRLISESIRCHHHPSEAGVEEQKMVSIVSLGNVFSHIIGEEKVIDMEYFDETALEILNLDQSDVSEIYSRISEEIGDMENLESFFE